MRFHAAVVLVALAASGAGCSPVGDNCIVSGRVRPTDGRNVVEAARSFIEALDYEQQARASFAFDAEQKHTWSNLPDGVLAGRHGLRLGDMNDTQCEAAAVLLFSAIPERSAQQIVDVMRADDVLAENNVPNVLRWSSDNYYWSVFGTPDAKAPWALQMNGHHVAITVTFADGKVTRAPDFLGIEPLEISVDGERVRPLDDERRVGLDAANAMVDVDAARIEHPADGILMGAGQDGRFPDPPEGVPLGEVDEAQRDLVREIVVTYLRRYPEPSRSLALADFDAASVDARFAWSGDVTDDSLDAYYRVHGPSIWIELSFEGAIGNDDLDDTAPRPHYHSIMRDPRNDYGAVF